MIATPWHASLVGAVILSLGAPGPRPAAGPARVQESKTDARGYDKVRIEQEDRLLVPLEIADEAWRWLEQRYVQDQEFVRGLDPRFSSSWSEELFTDTYFDTPSMQLYDLQSGVRHRHRVNLSDPDDVKSGRSLMQIKLNDVSSNVRERAEIKFEVEIPFSPTSDEDRHPMLGIVKPDHREPFKERLVELGLDPQAMRPVLTVTDLRRRIYLELDGQPFMSISHDRASSELWWGESELCEIEPELNEIGFTEADPETRAYMETVLDRVVADIQARFPEIRQDLTPKYNKFVDRLEAEVPFLRTLVGTGTQGKDYMYKLGALALAGIFGVGWFGVAKLRARARKPEDGRRAAATAV